jgi:uncharacterized protein YaaN involved in tellurite resistance
MTELEVLKIFIDDLRSDILTFERTKERHQKRIDKISGTSRVLKDSLEVKIQLLDKLIVENTERILALSKASRIVELAKEAELKN